MPGSKWRAVSWPAEALKPWPPSEDVRVICEIPFGTAWCGLGRTSDNQDLIHSLYVDDSQRCLRSVFPASTRMAAGSAWQRAASSFLAGRGTEALKSWPPSGDVRVICENSLWNCLPGFSRQYLTLQSGKMLKASRASRASESAECRLPGFSRQYLTLQSGKMLKLAGRASRVSEKAECGKCLAARGEQFPGRQRH